MRCPSCTGDCNQGRTCSALFQHSGFAVVNRGTGLHMPLPDETHDLPIVMFEDEPPVTYCAVFRWIERWLLPVLLGAVMAGVLICVGITSLTTYLAIGRWMP